MSMSMNAMLLMRVLRVFLLWTIWLLLQVMELPGHGERALQRVV